jgi:transposase
MGNEEAAMASIETLSAPRWKHLDEWFTFLSHPKVEPTNGEGEQATRPAVVSRKVWGGNRTGVGARAQGVLRSVPETCKRTGRSGLEFVSQPLRAFANPRPPRPILLTPR